MTIQPQTYELVHDGKRLAKQLIAVRECMLMAARSTAWLTLREIETLTHYPQASVSARLRELRADGYEVLRRRRSDASRGIWEYRVVPRTPKQTRLF